MAYTQTGNQRVTASGVIGVSGKTVIIYGFSFLSTGTAGIVKLYDGASAVTERAEASGTINKGTQVSFGPYGKFFPSGANVVVDGNTTYVDFDYVQVTI